jgi:uncharacterized protein (DUF58 family)
MKWYVGSVLLLLAALILESGLLAYAMYVLLALLVGSRLLARSWIAGLRAERDCADESVDVGSSVEVTVTLHNRSVLPVPWVLLEDVLPAKALFGNQPRVRVRKKRLKIAMLGSMGQTTLRYEIEFKMRGYYQIGPLVLETGDLFGLHRRYAVGTVPQFVMVYPKVVNVEGYELASRRPVGEVRLTHRLFEDPTRIAGVRPYEAGDPLNRVHWRASARTGVLHSKVYEPSSIAGASIVLDFHQAAYPAAREPDRSDLAVTTAASLAHTLYQMGQVVGLVSNGRDATDRIRTEGWAHDFRTRDAALQSATAEEGDRLQPLVVPARRGAEQFQRIQEALARVELNDGLSLAGLIAEAGSRLPRNATVVAILGDVSMETALALGNLRRQGYAVTAVLVLFREEAGETAYVRLAAEGIDVRYVKDEASVAVLCQRQMLR